MPGGGTLTIGVSPRDKHVEIRVTDTGAGIPQDIQGRIFEPFFTTKEVGKGTGLGLSLAFDIVSKHQGQLSLLKTSSQGTTFVVRLPITASQQKAA